MLEYRKGDLLASGLKAIAHGCNAQGVMGSGIAKQIKEKYPDCYKVYREELPYYGTSALGKNIVWRNPDITIFNMITQKWYGHDGARRYVSYDALDRCFSDAFAFMRHLKETELGIPKIGVGLGGGNWSIIEAIIKANLKDDDIRVVVYELE